MNQNFRQNKPCPYIRRHQSIRFQLDWNQVCIDTHSYHMYQHKIDVDCNQMHRQDTRSNSDIHLNMGLAENHRHMYIGNFRLYLSKRLIVDSRCKHLDFCIHLCQCRRWLCHLFLKLFRSENDKITHNFISSREHLFEQIDLIWFLNQPIL